MLDKKKKKTHTRRDKHQKILSDPETQRLFSLVGQWRPMLNTLDLADCCKSLVDRGCTVAGVASKLHMKASMIQSLLDQQKSTGYPPRSIDYIADRKEKSAARLQEILDSEDTRFVDIDMTKVPSKPEASVAEAVTPTSSPAVAETSTAPPMAGQRSELSREGKCMDLTAAIVWFFATKAKSLCHGPWLDAVFKDAGNDLYGIRDQRIRRPREAGESLISVIERCRPTEQFEPEDPGTVGEWLDRLARTIESDESIRIEAANRAQAILRSCPPAILDRASQLSPHSFLDFLESRK